ncbi:protein adenylyltransferase SelO family protein [Paraferrimonas sp. SM1919]|uniref:protein adenylyltransferase SelO family protein n=1 Tax=Paraferrimonas sp. SM1919 TaxID=2662263 RepID=UPI0013D4D205|nr:YdiU family protein [Paraferrimonas sp. SM1919]
MPWRYNYLTALPHLCSEEIPQGLTKPAWILQNQQLADELSIDLNAPQWLTLLAGNQQRHKSYAQVYSGHQFGSYTPKLGDGRGVFLGERQHQQGFWYEVFLKGSGTTAYSRHGDGRATLNACIKEFLASEAMYHLDIATTRSLGVIQGNNKIMRDTQHHAAITVRVNQSHIRFGHFQYARWGMHNNPQALQQLLNFTLREFFPELACDQQGYQAWFAKVVKRTATLVAKWQSIGFTHGAMNTDNMAILGDTIDYGTFAFLDTYNESLIADPSDYEGHYAFNMQPAIALWNLRKLADAVDTLIDGEAMQSSLNQFQQHLVTAFLDHMCPRMGLARHLGDRQLLDVIDTWRSLLQQAKLDYSYSMRLLSQYTGSNSQQLWPQLTQLAPMKSWLQQFHQLVKAFDSNWRQQRQNYNPAVILRNGYCQQAIEQAKVGNLKPLQDLYVAIQRPYDEPTHAPYLSQPPAISI